MDRSPVQFLLVLIAVALVVAVTRTPVRRPLSSTEETEAMVERMGLTWSGSGPPVVVFTRVGCAASKRLEDALQRGGIRYLRVDVSGSEVASAELADLGRNYLGTVATRATPTVVVGTRVVRGADVEEVKKALSAQVSGPPSGNGNGG